MANIILSNSAGASGKYLTIDTTLETAVDAVVTLVTDLVMTITASKIMWADFQPNTYTVTITNNDTVNAFELDDNDVILFETDAFPTASVTIDPESVVVTGNTEQNVTVSSGVLSMELTQAIANGTPTVITFEVNRVVTP